MEADDEGASIEAAQRTVAQVVDVVNPRDPEDVEGPAATPDASPVASTIHAADADVNASRAGSSASAVEVTTSEDHCAPAAADVVDSKTSLVDFKGFLKGLDAECKRNLKELPENGYLQDPLVIAMAEEKERSIQREAQAKSRMASIEKQVVGRTSYETDWREQVQKRKLAERRRIAEEEAAANAALEAFLQAEREKERAEKENLPLEVARRNWAANDRAQAEARARDAAAQEEGVRTWLDNEWLPCLEVHRQQLRDQRAAAERCQEEERQRLQRERDALRREDAASAAFIVFATAECQRRSALTKARCDENAPAPALVQSVLAAADAEKRRQRDSEARRRQAEEAARKQEIERCDRDYKEWKLEVRSARCRRKRVEAREMPTSDLEERRRLELQGRDYFKEKELVEHSVLEDALQRATRDAGRLEESGLSPRSILEEARKRAAVDKERQNDREPAKAEQELWDALLAKNRCARQQERTSRTPRWGVFTT